MAALLEELPAFLARTGRLPFVWGGSDCLTWCADWWKLRTGIDAAATYRGSYGDERGARRILRDGGGILAFGELLRGCLAAAPACGDVGIVKVLFFEKGKRRVFGPVGAICVKPGIWAVRNRNGIAAGPFELMRAWTPHG